MQAFVPMEAFIDEAIPAGTLKLVPYQVGMMCEGWQAVIVETDSGPVEVKPQWNHKGHEPGARP